MAWLLFLMSFILLPGTVVSGGQEGEDLKGMAVEDRIAGGTYPPEGKYPSLVRVDFKSKEGKWSSICLASILDRHWILTSAACFATSSRKLSNVSSFRVIAGDSILNETAEPYEQVVGIERFIIHRRVQVNRLVIDHITNDDLALAKVVPPFQFSHRVSPVNLPYCDQSFESGTGWIAGWGHKGKEPGPNINNKQKEVELPLVTNQECNKWLDDERYNGGRVNDLQICTRNLKGKGWCLFDWGAPLFLIKNESYMIQIGLASVRPFTASPPCGREGWMTVYTRISKYLGWIHRRISGCGNHPFYQHSGIIDGEDE